MFGDFLKLVSARGRGYRRLLRAGRFALGPVGPAAQVSAEDRAVRLLVRDGETALLLELVERASPPGKLYALFGLVMCDHVRVAALLAQFKRREDEVMVQSGCLGTTRPMGEVVTQRIEPYHLDRSRLFELMNK